MLDTGQISSKQCFSQVACVVLSLLRGKGFFLSPSNQLPTAIKVYGALVLGNLVADEESKHGLKLSWPCTDSGTFVGRLVVGQLPAGKCELLLKLEQAMLE